MRESCGEEAQAARQVLFRRLSLLAGPLPAPATAGAAGWDICAALSEALVLPPGGRALIPTGWAMALPPGHEAQVRPRSGLALKQGVTVLNSPGTIDADYRGELAVLLINLGAEAATIAPGQRIAQLVIAEVAAARPVEVAALDATARGAGGFGSTGS